MKNEVNHIEDFASRKQTAEAELHKIISSVNDTIPLEFFNPSDWYLAGGCVYCVWNNKKPKDYDLFCKNKNAIKKLRKWFRQNPDKASIITKNAISMGKYQFVIQHVGNPEVEVRKFDFKHNLFYYDENGIHNCVEWDCIEGNRLEFNSERARDILNILTRIPKFVSRGMEISQKEILDIIELGTRPTKILRERKHIKAVRSGKNRY